MLVDKDNEQSFWKEWHGLKSSLNKYAQHLDC